MDDCLFCRIERGELPATRVAENAHAIAIRDIQPRAPVHVLIIPREHIPTAADFTSLHGALLAGVFTLATEVARAEGLAESGYRLAFNVGAAAGMTVWHAHLHLLGGRKLGHEG